MANKYDKGEFTVVPSKSARRGLSPALQVVYMWLCDYSDKDNQCYPSRKTLAADCGMSVRTLDNALKELVGLGLIEKENRIIDNEYTTSLFTVYFTQGEEITSGGVAENDTTPHAESAHRTQPNINSTQLTQNDTDVSLAKSHGNPDINEMFETWQTITGIAISSKRDMNRRACSNLLKKHGKEGLEKLIRIVAVAQGDQYAPTISNFADLQSRLDALLVWAKKKSLTQAGKVVHI